MRPATQRPKLAAIAALMTAIAAAGAAERDEEPEVIEP